jgi:hypothetical protein
MVRLTLVGAALAAITCSAPAAAERWSDPGFRSPENVSVHRHHGRSPEFTSESSSFDCSGPSGHRSGGGHGNRGSSGRFDGCAGVYGGWSYYDADVNRSWDPDSFNDWWHDRPDRAYPRWVAHNQDCTPDRMWQGGGQWRCSW